MGDFVDKKEVDSIRRHYLTYVQDKAQSGDDRAARPASETCDATTFREVSSWYVNRLLRYIEIEDALNEIESTK